MAHQSAPLRYVVLRHENVPEPHFDLMFESEPGGKLLTWRSAVWPLVHETPLVQLGEHRRAYLDYEGPVSGNRGHVRRVVGGTFKWLQRGQLLSIVQLLEPQVEAWSIATAPDGAGIAIRA
jgi:hypothetical protein